MRTVIPLSPELGNSEIGVLLDAAEEHSRQLALSGGDVEVVHGGDGEHVATVRALGHVKHVRGGQA